MIEEIISRGQRYLPNEHAEQIFYDEEQGYMLYMPWQTATPVSVTFERCMELEMEKLLVADVHTHGCLPAFFSEVDNRDELGWRIFMVFGRLDQLRPEFCIRVGANGSFLNLGTEVFDDPDRLNAIVKYKGGCYEKNKDYGL